LDENPEPNIYKIRVSIAPNSDEKIIILNTFEHKLNLSFND
jgi:hypothetical protein